jgi:adenylate cyclase class 2
MKRGASERVEAGAEAVKKAKDAEVLAVEIEAKWFVDAGFQAKLGEVHAQLVQSRTIQRRSILDVDPKSVPAGIQRWVRVREEGKTTTLTLKNMSDGTTITGVKEIETVVESYDKTVAILEMVGVHKRAYQENARETWSLNGCQVTVDEWPGLQLFIEVEGPSERIVYDTANMLGLKKENARFGSIDLLYQSMLGIDPKKFNQIPVLTFENADEVLGPLKRQ